MGSKDTYFSLNRDELDLLSDTSFFLRKKQLINRIVQLYGTIEEEYDLIYQHHRQKLPVNLSGKRGKISRGENYKGLPYVILDAPALFEKGGVFAFRTLMWWGQSFSITFHLSGTYFDQHVDTIFPALNQLDGDILICINTKEWEHHHEPENYIPLDTFLKSKDNNLDYLRKKGFLKLSKMLPLDKHPLLIQTGTGFLNEILNLVK